MLFMFLGINNKVHISNIFSYMCQLNVYIYTDTTFAYYSIKTNSL